MDPSPLIVPLFQPWKHMMILKMVIRRVIRVISIIVFYSSYCFMRIIAVIAYGCVVGWLESVGSRVVHELDYKKHILYVVAVQSILGKLPVVPVGDTGTIPHRMR